MFLQELTQERVKIGILSVKTETTMTTKKHHPRNIHLNGYDLERLAKNSPLLKDPAPFKETKSSVIRARSTAKKSARKTSSRRK